MSLVSVIVPCYNVSSFIGNLSSVFEQSYKELELILVDDCSSDDTWQKLQEFKQAHSDKRIIVHHNEQNLGVGLTRNKGFALSGLIQGSGENYKLIGVNGQPTGLGRLRFESELDFWTPDNTDARYPIPDTGYGLSNNQQESTFWELNCRYVRLKNLQLSYDFKYKLLKNVPWISNLTLSLVGQNLVTISKANDYFLDPEQGSTDNYGYPIMRTYSLVLNFGF